MSQLEQQSKDGEYDSPPKSTDLIVNVRRRAYVFVTASDTRTLHHSVRARCYEMRPQLGICPLHSAALRGMRARLRLMETL